MELFIIVKSEPLINNQTAQIKRTAPAVQSFFSSAGDMVPQRTGPLAGESESQFTE
jgi:hypothetical protein